MARACSTNTAGLFTSVSFFRSAERRKARTKSKVVLSAEDKALVVARSCYPLRRTCSERPSYSTSTASLLVKYRPCPRERIGRFAQRHCNSRQARWHSTPSREAAAQRTQQPRCKLTREFSEARPILQGTRKMPLEFSQDGSLASRCFSQGGPEMTARNET